MLSILKASSLALISSTCIPPYSCHTDSNADLRPDFTAEETSYLFYSDPDKTDSP